MFQGHELNHLICWIFVGTEKSEKVDDSQPSLAYSLCREPQMLRPRPIIYGNPNRRLVTSNGGFS